MDKLYIKEKELMKLPLFYENSTNEAIILNYSDTEIIKLF